MKPRSSPIERFTSNPHPIWVNILVGAVLFSLPIIAAALDGVLMGILQDGNFRILLIYPAIILYIWLISPPMSRIANQVMPSLRPVILLDDEQLEKIVQQAGYISPLYEWLAVLTGAALGMYTASAANWGPDITYLKVEWYVTSVIMYGLLAWTIFYAIYSTRVTAALHRQPMQIDVLDPSPFQVVGKVSLTLALVFIGGITLSLLLGFQANNLAAPIFWIFNLAIILAAGLIFFLNMWPTHKILQQAKKCELEPLQRRIDQSGRSLITGLEQGSPTNDLALQIQALSIYEQRLQSARTWPYNTGMLRTLFFSVFIPLATILIRVAVEMLFRI